MSLNNNLFYNPDFLKEKLYLYISNLYGTSTTFKEDISDLSFLKNLSYEELFALFQIRSFDQKEQLNLELYNSNIINTINSMKCLEFLLNSILEEFNKFNTFEISKLNSLDKLRKLILQKVNTLNINDNNYKYIYKDSFVDNTNIDKTSNISIKDFLTLPIKETKEIIPNSLSIGNGSVGSYGSFDKNFPVVSSLDELLLNKTIQWESITNTCLLNLEINFSSPQIVNELIISVASIDDISSISLLGIKAIDATGTKSLSSEEKILPVGETSVSFYPIKTSKIILTLTQSESYLTSTGKQRKVIALDSLKVKQNKYDKSGTIKSLPIEVFSTVFTCLPFINLKDTNNNLYSITGTYSLDNKNSFSDINSIHNNLNISSIYYDLIINRNEEAFLYNSSLESIENVYSINTQTELLTPYKSPTNISLNKKSLNNNIIAYKPNIMAVGGEYKSFTIGKGTGSDLVIPLNRPIDEDIALDATLKVNNQKWTYTSDLQSETADAKVWTLSKEDYQTVLFGDNVNGLIPADGSTITFSLDLELLKFEEFNNGYLARLHNLFDPDKDQIKLISVTEDKLNGKFILPKNVKIVKLPYSNIVEGSVSFTERTNAGTSYGTKLFVDEQTFVDGTSELSATGDYSVDYRNGYLYCYENIQQDNNVTSSFSFYPTKTIDQSNYEILFEKKPEGIFFFPDKLPVKTYTDYVESSPIKISKLTPYGLISTREDSATNSDYQFNLSRKGVIKHSINCYNLFSDTSIVPQEVDYIDGYSEFLGLIKVTQENISSFSGSGIKSFTLFGGEQFYSPLGISFSDTIYFSTEKTTLGSVTSSGDYYIDSTTGTVSVYVSNGLPSTITCSYFYKGNNNDSTNLFSVDYKKGILHSLTPWATNGYIQYKTTNIYIAYSIIQILDKIEVDVKSNLLSIKSDGFYNKIDLVKIAYPYSNLLSNLEELKSFYSPLIESIEFRFK